MTAPTWAGWTDVIAAQNADVHATVPLYIGRWNTDDRDWVPQVYDTGITWDHESPIVPADVTIGIVLKDDVSNARDLWNPVGQEDTTWHDVPYPE